MGKQCVAHTCKVCGKAYRTRHDARKHVKRRHPFSPKFGVGQHVDYLWLDLDKQAAMLGGAA